MSEPILQDVEEVPSTQGGDIEMAEGIENTDAGDVTVVESAELPFSGEESMTDPRTSFVTYLQSPVVTLTVGSGDDRTVLAAHEALLTQSPFLKACCAELGSSRSIELTREDVDAVGCLLEYLYTGEYFPRKLAGQRTLESDTSVPAVDDTGDQLLKHARVYTLAEKWGLANLKTLASSKIHCVNSTAKGEIAYARYVYEFTTPDDKVIRAPVANFWATRSHTLRAEAEDEFRALCLEFPQFGYDVLTRVLDEKLKRERNERMHPSSSGAGSARKRARHSNI